MKKLAILLTLAMLVSSVSVLAAPQIDYMFYDEEDSTYYAFGSYNNPGASTSKNYDVPTAVGVYLGNNTRKFDLDSDALNNSKAVADAKFGIGFKGYEDFFEDGVFSVTPFYTYKYTGDFKGVKAVMDPASVDYTPAKSSNADIEMINIYYNGAGNTQLYNFMDSEFSPDDTEYTVYAGRAANYIIDYKLADSEATVKDGDDIILEDEYTRKITVTAENGETKTYTFNFTKPGTVSYIPASFSDGYTVAVTDDGTTYTVHTRSTYEFVTISDAADSKIKAFMTFKLSDVKDALKNASNIGLNFRLKYQTNNDCAENYIFNVYGVESGVDTTGGTVTYTPGNFIYTETPVGKLTLVGQVDTTRDLKYTLDVTDYVKELLTQENPSDYCTLALELSSFDYIKGISSSTLQVKIYDYTQTSGTKYNGPILYYR